MMSSETNTKKSGKQILLTAVITAVISVFISFVVFYFIFLSDAKYLKLKQLDFFVNNYFYGEVETTQINDLIVRGYLAGLEDKYARYYSVEETNERNKDLSGQGKGIGVIITKHPDNNNIFISNVYDNGPAAQAGIKSFDQIISVDGVSVDELGYKKAVEAVLKNVGEKVKLEILRGSETFTAEVTCTEFVAQTVFAQMLEDNIGFIEITAFNGGTTVQFQNAVNQLVADGAKALIFDLRNNGGGTVDAVCEMVDFICPEGDIMTVKYANQKTKVLAKSDQNEIDLPMVVLTNEGTASASELFTQSIKDFGKGISVGSKTYGKGVMQTTYEFTDGSSVAFTVAEFVAYGGVSFNEKGIEADIEVTLSEDEVKYQHIVPANQDAVVVAAIGYLNGN